MTHEEKVTRWIGSGKIGTEIGAGASPVPGLDPAPIYVDCFKSFGVAPNRADYYGHACRLPFHDHALDYVIASHVLEHVANPIAALVEWYRVVRPGGIIYLVVPNRRSMFDHPRGLTSVEHMLGDFSAGTTARDATHIDEFAFGVDWSRYDPAVAPEDVPAKQKTLARGLHETVARGEDINIHFHTFEPSNLRELLETLARGRVAPLSPTTIAPGGPSSSVRLEIPRLHWEIVDFADGFPAVTPNGVLAILRVHKGWRARAGAAAFRLRTDGDPRAVLVPDAQSFNAWAARTPGLGGVR
ncbi:methyltransferase domain-containing protein [Horticoccus sp. 23ND18S-11]|uniref:methyltransferase domain-containing protein n=1 Tax=Horticoccus sp. 23ND18S-11 TaxID=3391832 RepID=UPI0039C97F41